MRSVIVASLVCCLSSALAQTGPGGVGNATGSGGQPTNVVWLRANSGITQTGGLVDLWVDQSGNSNDAAGAGATRPTFNATDANFNNLPTLTFPNTASSNFFLQIPDNDNLDNTNQLTVFFIVRPTSFTTPPNGILSKRTSAGVNSSYVFQARNQGGNPRYQNALSTEALNDIVSGASGLNQVDIFSFIMDGTAQSGFYDGANNTTRTSGISSIPNNTSNLFIGSYDNTVNTNFEGQLAEVIIYRTALNSPQRQIVENYLSAKYNNPITGDLFAGDTPANGNYDFDLAGIGVNAGVSHLLANSAGLILSPAAGSLNVNGEFVLAAHNGATNTASTSNLGTGGVVQRWARGWYVDRTPATGIDVNLTFDFSEGIGGQFPQDKDNYVLLRFDGTNYNVVTAVTNSDKTLVGDQITFRLGDADFADGVYTIGTLNATSSPVIGVSNRTWYSYQSGNWNDPNVWTLDGGLFPLLVNPGGQTPGVTDNVVITSGRAVTMNINNVAINSMEVVGTLDVALTAGHNFLNISGTGRIRIAGATDNFPAGSTTNFADPTVGGTVEIYGSGMSINTARTWNNLIVNMGSSSQTTLLMNNLTVNGDFTISNGLFQINDNVAISNRTVNVSGDLVVAATGGIRVGTANARHELNLLSNFINDGGTANFTQRTSQITGSEANDGIVDVNLISGTKDQQVICNGVTHFYRIEVNKGSDDSFKASISSSLPGNFNLNGAANYGFDGAQLTTNDNALGLIYGTVEVGNNVTISPLNTSGNYCIFQGAQLWVNGGTVATTGNALVPYGVFRISAGSFTANVTNGITLRSNGVVLVEGGTVSANQVRTSIVGPLEIGSYIQSGGNVTVLGGSVNNDFSVFSLTRTGNVFNMSGGTLTVRGAITGTDGLRGGIFINSDPANISVTGGTVIMEVSNANSFRVTSRAPFWNVIVRKIGGSASTVELTGTTSGDAPDEVALPAQPLVVLNDFTLQGAIAVSFVTNSNNVSVSGNFEIQNGTTYTPGSNTTSIVGGGVSSLNIATGATQTFNNLVINKAVATNEAVIIAGASPAIRVNGTLQVDRGVLDYGSFILSARGAVSLASGATVGKAASTGRLTLDGTTAQVLSSVGAAIHNLEINNTNGVTLTSGDISILRLLTLTGGIFNINTRKLTLAGPNASVTGSFSATRMIQTAGNSSDGGLERYVDANETLLFPVGVAGKYTPTNAAFQSVTDDGLVRIVPVNGVLQTTDLTAGADILAFHWRASHSGFSPRPNVSYQFNYVDGDIGGVEANYVPGSVLDVNTFARSSDGGVDDVLDGSNEIVFNGSSTGGVFPGTGFTIDVASYTAGAAARFFGAPRILYVRSDGFWDQVSTWSLTRGGSNAPSVPGAGDVAVLRRTSVSYSGIVTLRDTRTAAKVVFDDELGFSSGCPRLIFQTGTPFASNFGTIEVAPTHQGGTPLDGNAHGAVIQYNVDNAYAGAFPAGDFGAFNNYPNALVIYAWQTGNGTITLSSAATEYPQLWFEGGNNNRFINFPNVDVTVRGRAFITGSFGAIRANGGATSTRLTFKQNLFIGSSCCGTGNFQFQGPGAADQTVVVEGNLLFTAGGTNVVDINNAAGGTRTHRLIVFGNIDVPAGTTLNLGSGSASQTNVVLELQGTGTNTFTNAGSATLFRIVMNKGTSIANTFTFSNGFTLTGPTNTATKAIALQNGLLVLNNSAIDVTLTSGGGDFSIPASAGLEVRAGTARTTTTSTNANILLDGLLRVSGGTLDVNGGGATDTNFIEYSNTGNASIEVTNGTMTVAGKIRRSTANATGVLRYTQTNGTVLIANEGADASPTRGVFEVLNPGSLFSHTGGSFTVVRGNGSATVPSVWLEPASSTVTGSTVNLGNASTPAGVASSNFGIQSTVPLNNLVIGGANNPVVRIYITPLTVNGNLTVNSATTLNSQGNNLTIGGNFTVDGSYVNGNNLTTFSNSSAASISGATPLFSFYDLTKTGAGTLTLARDITVNRDLKVLGGTFATGALTVNLKRHAQVDATIASTSGQGLVFNGFAQQQLTRTNSGTGNLGIVTVNNASGVIIPDGQGYDFTVNTGLRLQSGVFDIGGSLLFLELNALVTPVSPFSVANMIQTNSSFTDKGVRKRFPLSYTTDFVFPVGQLNYTPVTFNFSSPTNTTGTSGNPTITVRPANERHPSIVNDDEPPAGPGAEDFDDLQNVLQYHWIINADNVANTFRAAMTLQYAQSLVQVTPLRTEADYIPARILRDANPSNFINKFPATDVDETANTIVFNFSGVTDAGISGEYFAGVDLAIPDNVPIYTTIASGNVNTSIYTPALPSGVTLPIGAQVIIAPGHTVTFNVNGVSFYETTISAGATIVIPSGSFGHRLGTLTGTGDLRVDSNTASAPLPAAVYDDFFSCSGGGLVFGGTGSYEILGGINNLRNLTIQGSGTRSLANNDVTICNNLAITAGTLTNANNRTITIQNDYVQTGGTFNKLAGIVNISRDFTQSAGSYNGGTGGSLTVGRDLSVNAGTFTSGSGTHTVRVNRNMTVAGAATFTGGTSSSTGLRYLFQGSAAQTITGDFTSTRFINRLEINNSAGLTLGGNVDIERELILTSGRIFPGTGTNNLRMLANAVANPAEGRANSFVNGKLFKTIPSAAGSFVFPIGKGARWRSASLNSVSAAGVTWDFEYFGDTFGTPATVEPGVTNLTPVFPILRIASGEYWKVSDGTVSASGRTATVGLSWGVESDVSSNLAEREALQVVAWSSPQWVNMGGTSFSAGHTQARGTFVASTPLSFSERIVTLGSTEVANPLPVELDRFEARLVGTEVELFWRTASELNNEYFEIQRSVDGVEYQSLGRVDGKGTTNKVSNYFFVDSQPARGFNFYRLKQVDFDGKTSYSEVRRVSFDGNVRLAVRVHPNPTVVTNINLKVFGAPEQATAVRLFDLQGRIHFQHTYQNAAELAEAAIVLGGNLPAGVYLVEVVQGNQRAVERLVIR